jgi:hypothetical protein
MRRRSGAMVIGLLIALRANRRLSHDTTSFFGMLRNPGVGEPTQSIQIIPAGKNLFAACIQAATHDEIVQKSSSIADL